MPILLAALCLLPLAAGVVIEYLVCRFSRRKVWKLLPPAAGAVTAGLIAAGRWRIWRSEEVSPLTQILIFPVLSAVFLLLGFFLGYKLWKYLWTPRVINDK